jgi:hypothetical protein
MLYGATSSGVAPNTRGAARAPVRVDVTQHNLESAAEEEQVYETHAHHRQSLRRARRTSGG